MNKYKTGYVAVLLLAVGCGYAVTDFNDGSSVVWSVPLDDSVRVDWNAPGRATAFTLAEGGQIRHWLTTHHHSTAHIQAGSIGQYLGVNDNSRVHLSGGSIAWDLTAYNNSQVTLSGGAVAFELIGLHNAQIEWYGGTVGGQIWLENQAVLTLHGADFALDGVTVFGQIVGVAGDRWWEEPFRRLTGTLADGSPIDHEIRLRHNAKIILIPEPAALMLLCIGAVITGRFSRR